MDKIEIIDNLQVINTYDKMSISENVNHVLEDTIDYYYDLIGNPKDIQLDISPIDYYQGLNGVLIKKESQYKYVNDYRLNTYNYLSSKYSKKWVDNLLMVVNNSNTGTYIDKLTENIYDIGDLELIHLLVYIEADMIGKSDLYKIFLQQLQFNLIYNDTAKVLGMHLFEKLDFRKSYEFINLLKETNLLIKDKDLLYIYIILNKIVNNDIGADILLDRLSDIIAREYDKGIIDNDKFIEELQFVYSNYIDFYLKFDEKYDNLIQVSEQAVRLGDETANFHLIYGYIQKGDILNATHIYNKWRGYSKKNKSFLGKNPINTLEEFYLYGCEIGIIGATELLIKFYREEFENNGYNDDYFQKLLFYTMIGEYYFTDEDNIFFECFNTYIDGLEVQNKIFGLVDMLFDRYIETGFALYLDKILGICSKILRGGYNGNIEYKRKVSIWIEKMAVIDASRDNMELTDTLNEEYLKNKISLLNDEDYLDARFDELLLIMSVHNLQYVNTYSKILSIPSTLASIFDYFGMYKESNLALEYDEFFQKKDLN
ncbi:MAG: hypothetical protein Q8K30_03895 [Candidatus Gracilibacteria bacterium]|nr:hypothetical protein [Candidatus Gracilibacteria bacterium]